MTPQPGEALRLIGVAQERLRHITDHNADVPAAREVRWAMTDLDAAAAALAAPVAGEGLDALTLAMAAHRPTEFDLELDPALIADLLTDPEHDVRCAADEEPWPCAARAALAANQPVAEERT